MNLQFKAKIYGVECTKVNNAKIYVRDVFCKEIYDYCITRNYILIDVIIVKQ